MLISIADIATRLCRSGDDIKRLRERIMHWSRTGALPAYNQRWLGRGVPRLFEHGAIIRAALLSQLTDMDFDVTAWKHTALASSIVRDAARAWAQGDQRQRWLRISWIVGHPFSVRGLPELQTGTTASKANPAAVTLISLDQLFARIGWNADDEHQDQSTEMPEYVRKRTKKKKPSK